MDEIEAVSGNFPPEYLSPREKEKEWYGLQYARAMYGTSNRMGPRFFYDDTDYQALIEIAQGRQSVDNIHKLFGFHRDPLDDEAEQLAYIDIQVLNLAPKYINRAVAKMQKYSYDISVDAVDPVSVDEKSAYSASLAAFYRTNEWLISIGVDAKEMYPDLDIDLLPKFMDELMYDAIANPKIKKEIWAEIGIKLLHSLNNFQQVMREVDWDIVVIGKGHIHFYDDENGVPRSERINPKYAIGSYVDNESHEDQEYAGFFDWITINQLRKEMLADGKSEAEIKEVCDKWSDGVLQQSADMSGNFNRYDGLAYIPVLRFYFKSEDNRSFVSQKNQKYGFDQLFEKDYNYQPEESVQQYFENGERKLKRLSYTSIYGGTWVIDTDVVYNYGRKKYPRLNLVNATLPIKTFAPNMKEGRVVSFTAQMIEPLYMINVSWNKIKEILAKGWMGIREIDFTQLESISLGKGGQVWGPREVYEYLLKTNTLIKRSAINKYDQQYAGSGVEDKSAGLQLSDYFTTFNTALSILEGMTSTAVADTMNVPDRLPSSAVKLSAMTSDVDMEWLYNAHEFLYLEGSKMLLLLLQEAKRDKRKIAGFVPAMGKVNSGYFEAPDELAFGEYGLTLSRRPTEEQWANFYADVSIALANKEISVADSAFLREIDNLKQARIVMVIRHKQYKRQLQEEAKFNNDLAIQSNQAAAESKAQYEQAKEQAKGAVQREIEILKGQIQERLDMNNRHAEAIIAGVENQYKERIKKQEGLDSIIKESMRSHAERYKSDSKLKGDIISATQKAESDRKKLSVAKVKTV